MGVLARLTRPLHVPYSIALPYSYTIPSGTRPTSTCRRNQSAYLWRGRGHLLGFGLFLLKVSNLVFSIDPYIALLRSEANTGIETDLTMSERHKILCQKVKSFQEPRIRNSSLRSFQYQNVKTRSGWFSEKTELGASLKSLRPPLSIACPTMAMGNL